MNRLKPFTLLAFALIGAFVSTAQKIEMVDRNWISHMNQNKSDTTYIINFWATWCKPCVEELPHFEKLNSTYRHQKVKVILVSCDFKKQIDSRVIPFVAKNKLESTVVFMNETNPDVWLNMVDSSFSGAIPATLIINGKRNFRYFREGEITFELLDKHVNPLTH